MRNEEKRALRRELRGRRSQMGRDVRAAAAVKINRLLKRYIKRGRKIGVYWPMGKELRLGGFVRAAQKRGAKTRRKTLSALYRTAHAADVVYAVS